MPLESTATPSTLQKIGMRTSRIATVLISNAIPIVGVLRYGWSASNVLVLYWLESLLIAIFTCLRIAAHCWLTRRKGHWREGQLTPSPGDLGKHPAMLRDYAQVALPSTLVHGIFVLGLTYIFAMNHLHSPVWSFDFVAFGHGALLLLGVLAVEFCLDMTGIRMRPFAWMRIYTQQRMGRVLVLHLAIIFGMVAAAATDSPYAILYVLIGLKTLWDLSMSNAGDAPASTADHPPPWLITVSARVGKGKISGADLDQQWQEGREAARKHGIEDEQVMPPTSGTR
ncbi:MAG: DUF6498-containing protein [Dokdonella sp.]